MLNNLINDIDETSISTPHKCGPEECTKLVAKHKNNLNIISQNIRSVSANFSDFTVLLKRINITCDLIIFSECWLAFNPIIPPLNNYITYTSTNPVNQNDGVVAYVSNNLLNVSICEPPIEDASCLLIKIGLDIAVLAIYRPHAFNNAENFLQSLLHVLSSLSSFQTVVITGDINIDIHPGNKDPFSEDYLNLLAIQGLIPAHSYPTHGLTCLDHIIMKSKHQSDTLIIETTVTDHDTILLSININSPQTASKLHTKIDHASLKEDMLKIDLSPIFTISDVNKATTLMIDLLRNTITKNATVKTIPRRYRPIKPWITPGLVRCIRNRDNLHKKLKKSPENDILRLTYKRYRNFCKNILKNVKRQYDKKRLQDAGTNSKKIWDVVKDIAYLKKAKSSSRDLLFHKDTPQESVNATNHFFANVGKTLAENIRIANPQQHDSFIHLPTTPTSNSLVFLPTDDEEIHRIISTLRIDCAVGWDDISTSFIKTYRNIIIPPLTYICNLALSTGIFPDSFKKSLIHPIYKAGVRDQVSNYRPISVLSSMSKILERVINNRLIKYLESHKLLSDRQYGLRAEKSTAQTVHGLSDKLVRNIDNGKNYCYLFGLGNGV